MLWALTTLLQTLAASPLVSNHLRCPTLTSPKTSLPCLESFTGSPKCLDVLSVAPGILYDLPPKASPSLLFSYPDPAAQNGAQGMPAPHGRTPLSAQVRLTDGNDTPTSTVARKPARHTEAYGTSLIPLAWGSGNRTQTGLEGKENKRPPLMAVVDSPNAPPDQNRTMTVSFFTHLSSTSTRLPPALQLSRCQPKDTHPQIIHSPWPCYISRLLPKGGRIDLSKFKWLQINDICVSFQGTELQSCLQVN